MEPVVLGLHIVIVLFLSETRSLMSPSRHGTPTFYTVREVAAVLRVDPATIYRAIREDNFPAVRVRNRYVVPVAAVEQLALDATVSGRCIDTATTPIPRPREPNPDSRQRQLTSRTGEASSAIGGQEWAR